MRRFLKFLVYRIKTIDGNKNSAVKLLDLMYLKQVDEAKARMSVEYLSEARHVEIRQMVAAALAKKICFKYFIMMVR